MRKLSHREIEQFFQCLIPKKPSIINPASSSSSHCHYKPQNASGDFKIMKGWPVVSPWLAQSCPVIGGHSLDANSHLLIPLLVLHQIHQAVSRLSLLQLQPVQTRETVQWWIVPKSYFNSPAVFLEKHRCCFTPLEACSRVTAQTATRCCCFQKTFESSQASEAAQGGLHRWLKPRDVL